MFNLPFAADSEPVGPRRMQRQLPDFCEAIWSNSDVMSSQHHLCCQEKQQEGRQAKGNNGPSTLHLSHCLSFHAFDACLMSGQADGAQIVSEGSSHAQDPCFLMLSYAALS